MYGFPIRVRISDGRPTSSQLPTANLWAASLHDRPTRLEPPSRWLVVRVVKGVVGEQTLGGISCHLLLTPHCPIIRFTGDCTGGKVGTPPHRSSDGVCVSRYLYLHNSSSRDIHQYDKDSMGLLNLQSLPNGKAKARGNYARHRLQRRLCANTNSLICCNATNRNA